MNGELLTNSLVIATLVALAASGLGFLTALWLSGLGGQRQKVVLAGAIIALASPAFLVVNCWLDVAGASGLLRPFLPEWLTIYSLPGAAGVLTLMLWPIPCLATWAAWRRLAPEQFEVEPALRGGPLLRWLLWPAARKSLTLAAALVFVLALNNFAVPSILQVKVLPAEIWLGFNSRLDNLAALKTGWPLIVAPALLLWWFSRQWDFSWTRRGGVPAALFRRQVGVPLRRGAAWFSLAAFAFSVAIPAMELLFSRGIFALPAVAFSNWPAIWNSFWTAAGSATTAVAVGIAAVWLATRCRAIRHPLAAPLLWLPFFVPGVLLGIAMIFLLNRPGLDWLYGSLAIMPMALALRHLGPGWHGVQVAVSGMDTRLADAARLEGARGWAYFKLAIWPQTAAPLAAVWYIIYLLCLWDVETIVLIQPPGGETLALRVFNLLHYGHTAQVNALCLWLLLLALLPLLAWRTGPRLLAILSQAAQKASLPAFFLLIIVIAGCKPASDDRQAPLASRFFERAEIIGERGNALGQFSKPRSVAVDRQDNLYAVDMTGRVQKFSPDGKYLLSWQMPETDLGKAKGMGLDLDGNVIVIEPHYQRLNHFTPEAKLVLQWGVRGTNAGQFILPRAVAVNSRGDLYISEYTQVDRVQAFSARDKKLLAIWGKSGAGPGEFDRPEGLGIDASNRVYVADSCNHRIQVFDAAGKFLRTYGRPGSGPGELSYPYDIRIDAAGYQYVCEFGNSRIQVFDAQDRPVEIIGGPGAAPGRFSNPWGLALDANGNLYVADGTNHRVQKLIRRSASP